MEASQQIAKLVSKAVRTIKALEGKSIQVIQDEVGYAMGRNGGSLIEYVRKGNVPSNPADVVALAREFVRRNGWDRAECEQFLRSVDYPQSGLLIEQLFAMPLEVPPAKPQWEPSPFVVGPPIMQPRQFFGRAAELRWIFNNWNRTLHHVALVGPKRSGKTSLLYYLKNITRTPEADLRPNQKTTWLPHPHQYCWILVDFQDPRLCRQERLLRYLLTEMRLPIPSPCNLENFMDVLSNRLRQRTLILMDEVRVGLAAPELDEAFWWSLRSLSQHYTGGDLGFLVTADEIPTRLAEDVGKPSPFFNMFVTQSLGPFAEEEAIELISSSPFPFETDDVTWILKESGRWPALLQILCQVHLAALEDGRLDQSWRQEGLEQMKPFRYLLS